MSLSSHLVVFLHVLAAVVWLGGMLVFALMAPVLRTVSNEEFRQRVFHALGRRMRAVGWICITVLVGTGLVRLRQLGWWGADVWSGPFLASPSGRTLLWKLSSVVVLVALQSVHDVSLGPRAGKALAGTPDARALRFRAAWVARVSAVVGVVVVWFAVALTRGG